MITFVGDLHYKEKQPYLNNLNKFLDYLYMNHKDNIIVFTGDIFDSSSPSNNLRIMLNDKLRPFKEVHIITGNHDMDYKKGNASYLLSELNNTVVYEKATETTIEGKTFLMLPFQYRKEDMKDYQNFDGVYDFIIPHFSPKEISFEETPTMLNTKAKISYIWGHEHISKDFENEFGKNIVIGTPLLTRHGENHKKRLVVFDGEKLVNEYLEDYMKIKEINYGEPINDVDSIYHVKNAPSKEMIKKKYGGCFVRYQGCSYIDEKDKEEKDATFNVDDLNLINETKKLAEEKGLSNLSLSYILEKLSK